MPIRHALRLLALAFAALTLAGCAAAQMGPTWSAPDRPAKPYRDLVVIGVASRDKVRRAFEETFVAALGARGVKARAGESLVPPAVGGDAAAIERAVRGSGADAVLVTHMVGDTAQSSGLPTRDYTDPGFYGRLYPYYEGVFRTVSEPGYYGRYPALRLETNLYGARTGTLVWSGLSESMDPGSESTTIAQVVATAVRALTEAGYLP